MTLQRRLKRVMKQREWRTTDLARALGRPYTTVREWVLYGRDPDDVKVLRLLARLERP